MINTRRTVLKIAAILGGSSIAGIGIAQEDDEAEDPDFELGGRQSGWQGISPDGIEGETNPTLELVAGEEHVLVWENLDGIGHNFVIEDEDGEDLVETEIITNGTQTVEFTASEEMAEYYCQPHPTSMRGDVEIVEGESDNDTNQESEEFAAPVDELVELALGGDGWTREEPGEQTDDDEQPDGGEQEAEEEQTDGGEQETEEEQEDEAETNPTLELEQGGVYVIRWTNELRPEDVADNEDDGTEEAGADVQRRPSELVILAEDDEEIVRSDAAEVEGSAAVVLVATDNLEAYRDAETEAEGQIEVVAGEEEGDEGDETNGGDGSQEMNETD